MKNSSDTIGNRTRDLPACSAVPQPTAPPRAPSDEHNRNKFCTVQLPITVAICLHSITLYAIPCPSNTHTTICSPCEILCYNDADTDLRRCYLKDSFYIFFTYECPMTRSTLVLALWPCTLQMILGGGNAKTLAMFLHQKRYGRCSIWYTCTFNYKPHIRIIIIIIIIIICNLLYIIRSLLCIIFSLLLIWLFRSSHSVIFHWFYFVSLYMWLYVLYASA